MLYSIENHEVIRSNRSQFVSLSERENIDLYYHTLMHGDTQDGFRGFVHDRGYTYISDFAKAYLLGGVFVIFTEHYDDMNKVDQTLINVINKAMAKEPIEMISPIDGKNTMIRPHYKFYLFVI